MKNFVKLFKSKSNILWGLDIIGNAFSLLGEK